MTFQAIDPLLAKNAAADNVAVNAIKREIGNILDSYVGWFDPFAELIQNALDAVDERIADGDFKPNVRVIVDLKDNRLTVSDNGIGLSRDQFQKFLAPSFSFKSGNTRGHKGVGATYLAYGFNDIQIVTKSEDFQGCGRMRGGRKWLKDESPSGNPQLVPDDRGPLDPAFDENSRGTSVTVVFDKQTKPGKLNWLGARSAEQWSTILCLKTGLGAVPPRPDLSATIAVISEEGEKTEYHLGSLSYSWPHRSLRKTKSVPDIVESDEKIFAKRGFGSQRPSSFRNLDAIYFEGGRDRFEKLIEVDSEEKEFFDDHKPYMYAFYCYSTKIWDKLNEDLDIRSKQNIFAPGIQVAANHMPQGEVYIVNLSKNIGRQRQLHFVYHLENVRSDLGRKGFQKEVVALLQKFSARFYRLVLQKYHGTLKPATGAAPDLVRSQKVDDWKKAFEKHENEHPLQLVHEAFFLPKQTVSVTSNPTREQDVISLFNQLIAGGVIRGIQIMSTNERFTYDAMFRISFDGDSDIYVYSENSNPLGIEEQNFQPGFRSGPRILEYKYDLDGLIEDIEADDKNSNDIDMVVCWSVGDAYKAHYDITSLLPKEHVGERSVHGVTHTLHSSGHGQKEIDLIILEDLVRYLNDQETEIERQRAKYDEI